MSNNPSPCPLHLGAFATTSLSALSPSNSRDILSITALFPLSLQLFQQITQSLSFLCDPLSPSVSLLSKQQYPRPPTVPYNFASAPAALFTGILFLLPPYPHTPLFTLVTQSPKTPISSFTLMVVPFEILGWAVQVQFFGFIIKAAYSSSPPTVSPSSLASTLPTPKQLARHMLFFSRGGTSQPTPLTKSSLKGTTGQLSTSCPIPVSIVVQTYNNCLKVHNTPLPFLSPALYGPTRLENLIAALTIWEALPETTPVTLNIPPPLRTLLLNPSLSPSPHLSPPSTPPLPPSPSAPSFTFPEVISLPTAHLPLVFQHAKHQPQVLKYLRALVQGTKYLPSLAITYRPTSPDRIKAVYIHLRLELNACLEPYALSFLAHPTTKLTS